MDLASSVVKTYSVEVNGEAVPLICDGSTAMVNGEVVLI